MIGILITSHPGHCKVGLDKCMESIAGNGYATVLGFDDDAFDCDIPIPTGVWLALTGRAQENLPRDWKMHQGENIQIKENAKTLKRWGMKYILKLCGDMFLTTTDLWGLPDKLMIPGGEVDALTWEDERGYFGTKAFFAKTDAILKVTKDVEKINFLVESNYAKSAEKAGVPYKPMPISFWRQYVGGRF